MTAHELEMLQRLIEERFDDRDRKTVEFRAELDAVKNSMQRVESDVTRLHSKVESFTDVIEDLRDIRNGFQQVTRVAQIVLSKKTWAMLAAAIVVGNWIADHVPMFVGWFS